MKNGDDVKVSTGGISLQPGDLVEHVDDPRVRGKIVAFSTDQETGAIRARVEGVGNLLPAEKLRKAK